MGERAGVHVILDIVPRRIDAAAWADAFEETRRLIEAHPARLLGYGFRIAGGVRVPVFTRAVVQGGVDPAERRWCVAGDRATLGTGERQRLYRDLGRYLARDPAPDEAVPDDILLSPPSLAVRIFGDGDQSEPCQLALLGAAMVLETAFPRSALVSGSFDRAQAEAARRWAKSVLDVSLALPVRVDAFRLAERLGAHATGEALVSAVDQLHLAEAGAREAVILGIFGRAEAEPWLAAKLRACEGPKDPVARRLLAAYLSARHDSARLTALACVDPRGPRWPPEALAASLSAIEQPLRREPAPRSPPQTSGVEKLASIASPAELGPEERARVHAVALAARQARSPEDLASLLARGPTLTEDAWEWIEREQDPDLCAFVSSLAAFDPDGAEEASLRRVLLENRVLCRYAAAVR
jgi:hypothetical protein